MVKEDGSVEVPDEVDQVDRELQILISKLRTIELAKYSNIQGERMASDYRRLGAVLVFVVAILVVFEHFTTPTV